MAALIGNPMLLTSAPSGDDAHQIKQSVSSTSNQNDSGSNFVFTNTVGSNAINWTMSFWYKRTEEDNTGHFVGSHNGDMLISGNSGGWTVNTPTTTPTNASGSYIASKGAWAFPDTSAWYHMVIVRETASPVDDEKQRVYINGRRLEKPDTATATYTNEHDDCWWGIANEVHTIMSAKTGDSYLNGKMAEFYYIPDLSLGPASFGQWGSDGTWQPKAFNLPTPNQGATYSNNSQFTEVGGGSVVNPANFFDGKHNTYAQGSTTGTTIVWTPTTEIDVNCDIEIGTWGGSGHYIINEGESDEVRKWYANGTTPDYIWFKAPSGGKLKSFKLYNASGTTASVTRIKVDGITLIDGQTDEDTDTWKAKPPKVYSHHLTAWKNGSTSPDNTWNTNTYPHKAFCDGKRDANNDYLPYGYMAGFRDQDGSSGDGTGTSYMKWYGQEFEIEGDVIWGGYLAGNYGGVTTMGWRTKIDGTWSAWTDQTSGANEMNVTVATSSSGTMFQGFEYRRVNGPNIHMKFFSFRNDGTYLFDEWNDNGAIYLPFDDTTNPRTLGYNKWVPTFSTARAGPILKTTYAQKIHDDGGYNADSFAGTTSGTGLVLAIPGNSVASGTCDVHQQINTGSSNKTATAASCVSSTAQSFYYGSSLESNDTNGDNGDYVKFADSADFNFGSGDFTLEAWVYKEHYNITSSGSPIIDHWGQAGTESFLFQVDANRKLSLHYYDTSNNAVQILSHTAVTCTDWNHVACVRYGNEITFYLNGRDVGHHDCSVTFRDGVGDLTVNRCRGWLNDARIYKGVAKYKTGFIPDYYPSMRPQGIVATGNGITYTNLVSQSSGGFYSGHLTRIFDGYPKSTMAAIGDTDGSTLTVDFTSLAGGGIAFTQLVEVMGEATTQPDKFRAQVGGSYGSYVNGSSSDYDKWHIVAEGSGTLEKIQSVDISGNKAALAGIRVDGVVLVDQPRGRSNVSVDSPSMYGEDEGNGGEVRGNYAHFNHEPNDSFNANDTYIKLGNANHSVEGASSSNSGMAVSNWNMTAGKWYMEFTYRNDPNDGYAICGILDTGYTSHHDSSPADGDGAGGSVNVNISQNTSVFGSTLTTGDVMGMAVDCDNGACYFSKNGTWVGTPTSGSSKTGASGTWTPGKQKTIGAVDIFKAGNIVDCNWGHQPWKYTAPTGFKACCTTNLPDLFSGDALNKPSAHFNHLLYTKKGSDVIKGLGFSPNLLIHKSESYNADWKWVDSIRGVSKVLKGNAGDAESTESDFIASFDSDGFTLGSGGYTNDNNILAYAWNCGASAVTASTSGTITPTAQWVNTDAGFSITQYTGNNTASQSVGHGLSSAPEVIIQKRLLGSDWHWGHHFADNGDWEGHMYLGGNSGVNVLAFQDDANIFSDTPPDDTKWYMGANGSVNSNTHAHIAYCWHSIPGFSKFGRFTGNGQTEKGTFVDLGFKPGLLIIRCLEANRQTIVIDSASHRYNPADDMLYMTTDDSQVDVADLHLYSNGFKCRANENEFNGNGKTYIYMAWAEFPFKTTRAF